MIKQDNFKKYIKNKLQELKRKYENALSTHGHGNKDRLADALSELSHTAGQLADEVRYGDFEY